MDYVLSEAMSFLAGLTFLLVFYDIWCFYSVHLLTRMEKSPGISIPEGLVVSGGIDQFHVHGHKREGGEGVVHAPLYPEPESKPGTSSKHSGLL